MKPMAQQTLTLSKTRFTVLANSLFETAYLKAVHQLFSEQVSKFWNVVLHEILLH